jgi:hypothetical protein
MMTVEANGVTLGAERFGDAAVGAQAGPVSAIPASAGRSVYAVSK